jgi:4-hydroxybenzoate polyprenyltransferase
VSTEPRRRKTVPRTLELEAIVVEEPRDGPGRKGREGQTLAGDSLVVHLANFVKLPHTVFALPFALLGVVFASFTHPVGWRRLALVVVAFTAARFTAMGFNRIVDRRIDARNPRTSDRELPRQVLTVAEARGAVVAAAVVFVLAAGLLNPLCLLLSPLALAWILTYSYTKRFTHWSHLWLGVSLAIAPAGGFMAVTGSWSTPALALPVIAVAVITWVAGFDMFYALQDEEFDREHDLGSAVVLLGKSGSIILAKSLHGITILALLWFGLITPFGVVYLAGLAVAAAILIREHQLVSASDLSRLDSAFFTMNGIMSLVVFSGALADRLL